DFNIVINVGESPNAEIFQAHSAILKYRSLYFCNELANIRKDENNIKTLNLKNLTIQQFEIIIKYIYGGVVLLENHNASFIFELMLITCEFLFNELAKYLETHLIETEAHWLRLNFTHIYKKIFKNNKLQELQKCAMILYRDDLQMEEVKIWNYVIKWGIAQNPGLPSAVLKI
ncbi:hypothetical protein C2G38_2237527, partial [Gigaspora rosea]